MSKNLRAAHLSWLLQPIQRGVDISKVSLDTYHKKMAELSAPPSDAQKPWFDKQQTLKEEAFGTLCHEVDIIHSALTVAGCLGGATLALEIKVILNNINVGQLDQERIEEALLSVQGGLFMIPSYIKMVVRGSPDTVAILAKPINELREIRGVPLLVEDNLLAPDIEFVFVDPPLKQRDCPGEQQLAVFKASPKRFKNAFSAYIANHSKSALAEMKDVLRDLQMVTNDPELGCFWWVGECLADALSSGAIRSGGHTLSQIRMLSVAIQKADTEGEAGAKQTLGATRFKSLLSVLSMSNKLSKEIEDVLAVFNVAKSVDASDLGALQDRIATSQAATIQDVASELKPLLEAAMISLGRAKASRHQPGFDAQFAAFHKSMRHVTSVFYMVNQNELAAVSASAIGKVQSVRTAADLNDEVLVESLLKDILYLDECIELVDANEAIRALNIAGVKPDTVANVVSEALKELGKTRKLISQSIESGTGTGDLQAGLQGLLKASSALAFIGASHISALLNGSCRAFMDLLGEGDIKNAPHFGQAVRSMVALEVYLTAIAENLEPQPELLLQSEQSLASVGIEIAHAETLTKGALLQIFESTQDDESSNGEAENQFIFELSELRADLESCLPTPDVRNRFTMDTTYKAADRLSVAAKMHGLESFSRISRALATYCQFVQGHATSDGFDIVEAKALVKQGVDLCLRCVDEYSARGKMSLFTKELEILLLTKSDPDSILSAEEASPQVEDLGSNVPLEGTIVLRGDLQTESCERGFSDDYDSGLIEIFKEEYESYHTSLVGFCSAGDGVITREICRTAHSIHGASGSAGCIVLHSVFGALETRLNNMLANDDVLRPNDLADLSQLLHEMHAFLQEFPWETDSPAASSWRDIASGLGQSVVEIVFKEMPKPVVPQSVAEAVEKSPAQDAQESQAPENISHAKSFSVTQQSAAPGTSPSNLDLAPDLTAEPERAYNEETASFYLDETDDVLPDLQSNVSEWLLNMGDLSLVSTIKRQMHTLKGAANMADASSISALTHSMESLFESISLGIISTSPDCAELVSMVLDAINNMTSVMRQGLSFSAPRALIACLEDAVETNAIHLSILEEGKPRTTVQSAEMPIQGAPGNTDDPIVEPQLISHAKSFEDEHPIKKATTAPSVGTEQGPLTAPVHDYSEETVGFYLDEADDVLPELHANVLTWIEDTSDIDLVSTIKRQMHTLKGAALMAKANSIIVLTSSMESLFENFALSIVMPGPDFADLVSVILDAITNMTSMMRQGVSYEIPTALIKCLENTLSSHRVDLSWLNRTTPIATQQQGNQVQALEVSSVVGDEASDRTPANTDLTNGGHQPEGGVSPSGPRKKKRGGRGRGGAIRHAEANIMVAAAPAEIVEDNKQEVISAPPALDPVLDDNQPEVQKISHAKSSSENPEPMPILGLSQKDEFARQAEEHFNRLYSIEDIDETADYQPVQSRSVLDLLNRSFEVAPSNGKKQSIGPSEKIKVDLQLLENAAVQSSELTAIRHRLSGLNEDQIMGLTAIREMLEANSLQHSQFTTALRGYFNHQPHIRSKSSIAGDADLERFTDLSAIQVSLGAQVDQILAEVEMLLGLGLQKRNAFRDQGELISNLQRDLLDSRLVQFMNVKPKLSLAIKDACTRVQKNGVQKNVNATYIGSEVFIDRMILEGVAEPLTHILRNAIDHGIEAPDIRAAFNKPPEGSIEITVYRRAKNVVISVRDDGRGIDLAAIRAKAVDLGLIHDADSITNAEALRLITRSGFSTAQKVTDVSGRGVGMDIVAKAIENLGGQLIIESTQGVGTTFTIELPFTIGSNKAMMCSPGNQWFAIPSYFMRQVIMTSKAELARQREQLGHAVVEYEGVEFEVVCLADLIAMPDLRMPDSLLGDTHILLCEQGDTRIAVEVAKVESMPEIHIRKSYGLLSQVRGIVGETEMQDGTPVFVLDVMELARLNLKGGPNGYQVRQNRVRSMKRDLKPTVLVVDDSRSYRTLLERHFSDRGYAVFTARDGLDALHQLAQVRQPDLMVVDVEMPRMNGFEFIEEIRSRAEYNKVPIMMITTRTGLEEKAFQAGANAFLNKPCDDAALEHAVAKVRPQKQAKEVAA